jgi:hypothetical protein
MGRASFFEYAIKQAGGIIPTNPPLRTKQFERQAVEEKGRQEGPAKKSLTYSYMGIY